MSFNPLLSWENDVFECKANYFQKRMISHKDMFEFESNISVAFFGIVREEEQQFTTRNSLKRFLYQSNHTSIHSQEKALKIEDDA